jgi:cell division control protein 24
VLFATNAAVDREERLEAVEELRERVEDWKGHRIESFGELLLHGTHQVVKGDTSNPKDQEREVWLTKVHQNVAADTNQYKIYLFAMILLCCKEVKSAKEKNKMIGKPIVDRKGRPKLQLKGRIFMQNVTDTVASVKPGRRVVFGVSTADESGSYTCQIFWKGDPGIEYFTIKFTSEETMKRWCDQVNTQKRIWRENARASARPTTAQDLEFSYLQHQHLENPYLSKQLGDDDDDDDLDGSTIHSQYNQFNGYSISRNDSNTSLRSRSTTGESGPPMMRVPPRQFPMGQQAPSLQVRTGGPLSPGDPGDASFFSPTTDSPISTRSSGTPSMFFLPRQQMPPLPPWEDHRYTAPAMPRTHLPPQQRVQMQRPSLPLGGPLPVQGVPGGAMPSRLRSASSPDIANTAGGGQARYDPALMPPMPDLPPFPPSSYAYPPGMLSRSQSSSPAGGHAPPPPMASLPVRASTQTPVAQLARLNLHPGGAPPGVLLAGGPLGPPMPPQMGAVPMAGPPPSLAPPPQMSEQLPRSMPTGTPPPDFAPGAPRPSLGTASLVGPQPGSMDGVLLPGTPSPPPAPASAAGTPRPGSSGGPLPTQLKVKVHCSSGSGSINSMTFVVPINISFQSLKDRIDVKLQRSSTSAVSTLSSGHVKLKYLDDDDFVSIQSDEDVQMAFETWRESQKAQQIGGGIGEIELYIQ